MVFQISPADAQVVHHVYSLYFQHQSYPYLTELLSSTWLLPRRLDSVLRSLQVVIARYGNPETSCQQNSLIWWAWPREEGQLIWSAWLNKKQYFLKITNTPESIKSL